MHIIYLDEAGIGDNEPVTVCTSLIVDGDEEWTAARAEVERTIFEHVPIHFREGFVFHATEIWNSKPLREGWDMQARLLFLKEVMAIPRRLNLGISLGICRREAPLPEGTKVSRAAFHHVIAFHGCLAKADQYVRASKRQNEVAIAIAEDSKDMRKLLRATLNIGPILLDSSLQSPTRQQTEAGTAPNQARFAVEKIVDDIHFVDGSHAPLMQIVDACAFGFRRYFSEQKHGDEMVGAILGNQLIREDWAGLSSYSVWSFKNRKMVGA